MSMETTPPAQSDRAARPRSEFGMGGRLLTIGECMVEMKQAGDGLWRKGYAGDTFNAAYYARLFLPPIWQVDYLTAVGTCPLSMEMLEFMQSSGVGTGFIRRIEGGTPGLYMIHLDDKGERSFSYWRSASAARRLADDSQHLRTVLGQSDVILVSGITLAILPDRAVDTLFDALKEAKADGRTIVFDPNIRARLWNDADRLRHVLSMGAGLSNIVMPSFDDEVQHFGDGTISDTIARYRALGVENVVVKDGGRGITLSLAGEPEQFVPACPIPKIVDSTSAGDSFNGAFLARLVTGASGREAAAFAAQVAAKVISHHGALVEPTLIL